MTPATGTAILVVAVFVLPGFVTLLFRERTYWIRGEDTPFERLLSSLYYSSLVYGVLLGLGAIVGVTPAYVAKLYGGQGSLPIYLALGVGGLFAIPLVIAEAGRWWYQSDRLRPWALRKLGISKGHRTPSGWEHFFLKGEAALVRVTLDDGRVIGGYFGDDSLAGYSADRPDLYLEDRWILGGDDWFVSPAPRNMGVWIAASQIRSFEAYRPPETDEAQPHDAQPHDAPKSD